MSKPVAFLVAGLAIAVASWASALSSVSAGEGPSAQDTSIIHLFDRWELVWNEGRFDQVPWCVADQFTRHDDMGDRSVTRETYADEIAKIRKERPDIRVVVYDHSFQGDRAWFRFAFKWTDSKTGEKHSRAGTQSYRVEAGKLAETWLSMRPLDSVWTDAAAQEHWTSPPPIK